MAVQIPFPSVSYADIELSLAGKSFTLTYRFNTRWKKDEDDLGTWVIDIRDANKEYVIKGLGLVGQGFLLGDLILDGFDIGDFLCVRAKKTDRLPTRDNIGIDREYKLLFLTNEELASVLS